MAQRRTEIKNGPSVTVEIWLSSEAWVAIANERLSIGLRLRPDECRAVAGHLLAVAEEIESALQEGQNP
jgi:hypothetical protein